MTTVGRAEGEIVERYCSVVESIVAFKNSAQPSFLRGRRGMGGLGPPNPIHKLNASPAIKPVRAPCRLNNVKWTLGFSGLIGKRTFCSTTVENIPMVKRASSGPPTTPNMVRDACSTPPKYSATNAIAMLIPP